MVDICNKCGKMIKDVFDKKTEEKDNKKYEFHSSCFDIEEFYHENNKT